jgi:hypothetical protein
MLSKRFRHLSLSVLISGLCALPVGAQNFTFDSVTCINYDTGQVAAGSLQGGGIECSGLPTQAGDHIGVVLSGVADDGGNPPPPPVGECQQVSDQEPNDEALQEAGLLASGDCLQIDGSTHTGYGDPQNPSPGFDRDQYLISPQGITSIALTGEASGPVSFDMYDPITRESLACEGTTCTVPAGLNEVGLIIFSPEPVSYHLELRAGGAGGSGLQGAKQTEALFHRNSRLR